MLRIRSIMLLFWIVMCFFNIHNAFTESIDMENKNNFKVYPFNHKFRNISTNFKTSGILDNQNYKNCIYTEGIIAKFIFVNNVDKWDYLYNLLNCIAFFLSPLTLERLDINKKLFQLLRYRDIIINSIIKSIVIQNEEYIWFSYKNIKVLYRYLSLDWGYCSLKCDLMDTGDTYVAYNQDGDNNVGNNNRDEVSFLYDVFAVKTKQVFDERQQKEIEQGIFMIKYEDKDTEVPFNLDDECAICLEKYIGDSCVCSLCAGSAKSAHIYHKRCILDYAKNLHKEANNTVDSFIVDKCPLCKNKQLVYSKGEGKICDMFSYNTFFYLSLLEQLTFEYSDNNKASSFMPFFRVSLIVEPILYVSSFFVNNLRMVSTNRAGRMDNNQNINNVQHDMRNEIEWIGKDISVFCNINFGMKIEGGCSYKNYYFLSIYLQPTICINVECIDSEYSLIIQNKIYKYSNAFKNKLFHIKIGLDFFINNRDEEFLNTLD